MLKLFSFLLFLSFSTASIAEFAFSENCKKAYQHIFNLEYEEAGYLIGIEKLYNPANPSIIFLNSGILFMKSILEEDPEAIKDYFKLHNNLISALDNEENILEKQWLLGETYFHSALINFKLGNYLQGAWQLRKAYRISIKSDKSNPLLNKIPGLSEAFASTIPDDYKWALKIFGIKGNLNTGTDRLYGLYNKGKSDISYNFILPEMIFYIAYIENTLLKNADKAIKVLKENKAESSGPFGVYVNSLILMKSGRSTEAEKILSDEIKGSGYHPFPYLIYMFGTVKLQNLDLTSEIYFNKYIKQYKGKHYIKATTQKLAWIELLKGNLKNYNKHMSNILITGSKETDEDRQAQREAETKEIPDIMLLKSRLLFDGGNYTKAEKELAEINIKNINHKQSIEYYYRLGRIKQEQKNTEAAELNFFTTIELQGNNEHYYFAPNAALQIAILAEEEKNFKKAEEFYKKAYSHKKHEYKNSIQQKAKAGLERIKKLKS